MCYISSQIRLFASLSVFFIFKLNMYTCTFTQLTGCITHQQHSKVEVEHTLNLDMCSYNITLSWAAKSQQLYVLKCNCSWEEMNTRNRLLLKSTLTCSSCLHACMQASARLVYRQNDKWSSRLFVQHKNELREKDRKVETWRSSLCLRCSTKGSTIIKIKIMGKVFQSFDDLWKSVLNQRKEWLVADTPDQKDQNEPHSEKLDSRPERCLSLALLCTTIST